MTRPPAIPITSTLALAACAVVLGIVPTPLEAQAPDARTVPRGALRVGFSPLYQTYDRRFTANGSQEALGTDFSADRAGSTLFPSVLATDGALQAITGDINHRINIGMLQTKLDADVRRFPLSAAVGLTDRFTLRVELPIVTSRVSAAVTLDTTGADAGWNQAAVQSGNSSGALEITALLSELDAAVQTVETNAAGGGYGCPGSSSCMQAQALAMRVRSLVSNLTTLTGVTASGGFTNAPLPPFAPTAASVAGQALTSEVADVSAQLQALGLAPVSGMLPLPDGRLEDGDVNAVLTEPAFGYSALPLEDVKLSRIGDLEVGARYALVQTSSARAVVGLTVRLPTGMRDSPDHFIDLGTGDRQLDLKATLEGFVQPAEALSFAVNATYTRQLSDRLARRVTSPHEPIAFASTAEMVDRSLGDILTFGAYPTLHLHPAFRIYGAVSFFRKSADSYGGGSGASAASVLAVESGMTSLSYGAGLAYRSTRNRGAAALPIEAGLAYRAVFSGSGGFTPKGVSINLYLRLFYRLFGGAPREPDPAADPPAQEVESATRRLPPPGFSQ